MTDNSCQIKCFVGGLLTVSELSICMMAGKQDGTGEVATSYMPIYRQQVERNRDRHWAFYDLLKLQGPPPVMHFLQQDHTS